MLLIKLIRSRWWKLRVTSLSILGKLWNISETTSQQNFPKFMHLHGVTTSCYMLLVKLKCLDGKQKLRLLNTIGVSYKVSDKTVKCVEKLIQTIYYPGRIEESLNETRVWLHKQMKIKTFQPLRPEEKSMLQAITRVHYQVFYSS